MLSAPCEVSNARKPSCTMTGNHQTTSSHGTSMCGRLCQSVKHVTVQSERGRITAALNADQLIGRDYSKLSLGVRSRYKTASDSEALLCDAEPLVRHSLAPKTDVEALARVQLHWCTCEIHQLRLATGDCAECESGRC